MAAHSATPTQKAFCCILGLLKDFFFSNSYCIAQGSTDETSEILLKEIFKKLLWTGQSSKNRGLCELGLPFPLTLTIWHSLLQASIEALLPFFSPNLTPELQKGMIQLSTYHLPWRIPKHFRIHKPPSCQYSLSALEIFYLLIQMHSSLFSHTAVFPATLRYASLLSSLILLSSHIQVRIHDPFLSASTALWI